MNYYPFNRKYLKQHSRLSVFMWILTSVAWESRTIKVKSGQFIQIVQIERYEVYAPISRIHAETGVSTGRCHQILEEFKFDKFIEKRSVPMNRPVRSPVIIKIINPTYIEMIDYLSTQFPKQQNHKILLNSFMKS